MNTSDVDYERLNRRLKSYRDTIKRNNAKGVGSLEGFKWQLKRITAVSINLASQKLLKPFKANEWILLQLQILSLPDEIVGPKKLAVLLPKTLSKIISVLKIQNLIVSAKPQMLFSYLFLFKKYFTNDRLLYIYLNHSPEEFCEFISKLKRKIILVLYEISFIKFPAEYREKLELWCLHWIELGLIKEEAELKALAHISIGPDAGKVSELEIDLKYFAKQKDPEKLRESKPNSSYTGSRSSQLEDFFKQFRGKHKDKPFSYIESFYELVFKIYSNKHRFDFFKNEEDRLLTVKSRLMTNVRFFLEHFGFFQLRHYLILWDVLRIISVDMVASDKKMLLDIVNETAAKIFTGKYIYKLEEIKNCFAEAIQGTVIVDIGDEQKANVALVKSRQREAKELSVPFTFEGYYADLLHTISRCEEDKIEKVYEGEYIEALDDQLFYSKVDDYTRAELLHRCFMKLMEESDYGIDMWKKQKVTLYAIRDLRYIDEKDFNKLKEQLYAALKDTESKQKLKISRIEKADLLLPGMTEDKLTDKCTKEDIKAFIEENEKTVQDSYSQMNEIAKKLYNRLRADDERYKELDKVIGR